MEYRSEYNCYALFKFYVYLSRYGPRASNCFYWYIFFRSDGGSSLACHSCRKLRLCNKPYQQYLIFVNERGKRYYVYLPSFLYSKTASARINWRYCLFLPHRMLLVRDQPVDILERKRALKILVQEFNQSQSSVFRAVFTLRKGLAG